MANNTQGGSPPRRPSSITFNDKPDVFEESKGQSSGALEDLGEDTPPKDNTLDKDADTTQHEDTEDQGEKEADEQVTDKSPSSPPTSSETSPPKSPVKDSQSVDSAATKKTAESYVPSPYSFRAPAFAKQLKRMNARCPPFYLQLDHTLAVIWALFSEEPALLLGIVQLQWALNFLKGIYTRRGEHPKDVALCILATEDLLMERYAEMVQDVTDIEEKEEKKKRKMYESSDSLMKSKITVCESETCMARLALEGLDDNRESTEETDLLLNDVPFSVNYSEMSEKAGTDVEQLYSKQSRASTDASLLDFDVSQENVKEFLRQWRLDQINKIQADLKRLHSIEQYIGYSETNFDNTDEAE